MHIEISAAKLLRETPNAGGLPVRFAVPWHVPVQFDTLPCGDADG